MDRGRVNRVRGGVGSSREARSVVGLTLAGGVFGVFVAG